MRVLDQNGSLRDVLPSQVMNKITPRRNAVSTDRHGSEVRHGDTVREVSGEQRLGTILHIHRAFLFLRSKTETENAGVIVTRASNVTTIATSGNKLTNRSGPDLSMMNPAMQKNGMNGNGMPPPRSFGRDRTLGKTVTIRRGPFKGLLGIVKDTTDTQARVELHAKNKIVSVDKDMLSIKEYVSNSHTTFLFIANFFFFFSPITGAPMDLNRLSGNRGNNSRVPFGASAAPSGANEWQGSRTPMAANDSSRTPAWRGSSSRSKCRHIYISGSLDLFRVRVNLNLAPAWGSATSGSRTPAWKADGSRTAYGGGATAYGGPTFGSRTPAWTSGSKTPYDSNSGFTGSLNSGFDAFAAGSRTPAYGGNFGGSRTPAWGPGPAAASNSSTSKSYDAPTPGGDYSAPTPGAYGAPPTPGASAPTPRGWPDNAPTPGAANAPTPGYADAPTPAGKPYDAPTPAFDMGAPETPGIDGGPRYEEGTPSP